MRTDGWADQPGEQALCILARTVINTDLWALGDA
jgi:hypothetical protein